MNRIQAFMLVLWLIFTLALGGVAIYNDHRWQQTYDANQEATFYEGVYAGCFGLIASKVGPNVSEVVCNKLVRDGKAKDVFHQGDKFYPGYGQPRPAPAQQTPAPRNNGESGA